MNDNHSYGVVSFADGSVSEVPLKWLSDSNTNCWWPPSKNVSLLIQRMAKPDENTWMKFPVKLERVCQTLESARNRAKYEDYSSNDDYLSRRRIPKKTKRFEVSEDEASDNEIKLRVADLERKFYNQDYTSSTDQEVLKFLPLKTVDDMERLEDMLKDEQFEKEYEAFLRKIGGTCPKEHVLRALKRVFTNQFANLCSWQGLRNNIRIGDKRLIKGLLRAILYAGYNVRENEMETIIADWLRHAKQRLMREKEKEQI